MTLADRWFRPRKFETDGRFYRWLGVVAFKRLLMGVVRVDPANPAASSYVLGGRSLGHLRAFERKSRRSELIHLGGLTMGVVLLCLGAIVGSLTIPGMLVFAVNFHCFALQRYNRARIDRVLQHAAERRSHAREL